MLYFGTKKLTLTQLVISQILEGLRSASLLDI